MSSIKTINDLRVFQLAFNIANEIFEISKEFPNEEKFSLTDQIRRSSRSVCANIAEAFRRRLYPKNFISKIIDSEAEAEETIVWLQFAFQCKYLNDEKFNHLIQKYSHLISMLVIMRKHPEKWQN
jgi:four helix bundle protein